MDGGGGGRVMAEDGITDDGNCVQASHTIKVKFINVEFSTGVESY